MPQPIYLALAFHNHQPVGNFDWVFAEAFQKSYQPMVEIIEKHPAIRLGLHYTGPLRDWIIKNRPDFFPRVAALVARGQVEMLTGGYYEPILVAIPDADKLGQIAMLSESVRADFGSTPQGAWLAERVWEPSLAKPLAQAGVDYIIVDDTHFKHVGLSDDNLFGYYVTEEQGFALKIFGSSKQLRYSIPWAPVSEVIDWLRKQAQNPQWRAPRIAVMGDDGEKFGLWPETYRHVWEKGWLEKFFAAIEQNSDWLQTTTLGDYARQYSAIGRIYLPTASYDEMTEWALPPDLSGDITELKHRLQDQHRDDLLRFIRGGFWRNFLVKYPEVNNMHKKMLRVHDKVYDWGAHGGQSAPDHVRALDHLWAGQCNCPYWHGVFGGIYLSHIRTANYAELIAAEQLVDQARHPQPDWVQVEETDVDKDSHTDVLVETGQQVLYLNPASGGSLFEWDWRDRRFNLLNNLTRHKEGYHRTLVKAVQTGTLRHKDVEPLPAAKDGQERPTNIHALVRAKEKGLENYLFYDWYQRTALLDHFLHGDVTLAKFRTANYGEAGDFMVEPYDYAVERATERALVTLWRDGHVWIGNVFNPVRVEKQVEVIGNDTALAVAYHVTNSGSISMDVRFGVEFNFGLLSGHAHDAYYALPGMNLDDAHLDSIGELQNVSALALVHRHFKLNVHMAFDRPATLWRFPIETISNSEGGFERTYQSSCLLPYWWIRLAPGQDWRVNLRLSLREMEE
jgi:4-alpha-glucanotransferase